MADHHPCRLSLTTPAQERAAAACEARAVRDRILVLLLGHLLDADRRDALTDLRQRLSEVEGGARERLGRGGGR